MAVLLHWYMALYWLSLAHWQRRYLWRSYPLCTHGAHKILSKHLGYDIWLILRRQVSYVRRPVPLGGRAFAETLCD